MAGDWIKMQKNLSRNPKVRDMRRVLKVGKVQTMVGFLHDFWSWTDDFSVSGELDGVTEKDIDEIVGVAGFSAALRKVGWLEGEEGDLRLPNFTEHNGQSAKRRAMEAERVRKKRNEYASEPDVCTHAVRTVCGREKSKERRDKKREDQRGGDQRGGDEGKEKTRARGGRDDEAEGAVDNGDAACDCAGGGAVSPGGDGSAAPARFVAGRAVPLPADEDEVVAFLAEEVRAGRIAMSGEEADMAARIYFAEASGRGWVDSKGLPLHDWRQALRAWGLRYARNQSKGRRPPGQGRSRNEGNSNKGSVSDYRL